MKSLLQYISFEGIKGSRQNTLYIGDVCFSEHNLCYKYKIVEIIDEENVLVEPVEEFERSTQTWKQLTYRNPFVHESAAKGFYK